MYEKQAGLQYPCTFIGYPPPLLHPASARCGAVDMQTNDDEKPTGSQWKYRASVGESPAPGQSRSLSDLGVRRFPSMTELK